MSCTQTTPQGFRNAHQPIASLETTAHYERNVGHPVVVYLYPQGLTNWQRSRYKLTWCPGRWCHQ